MTIWGNEVVKNNNKIKPTVTKQNVDLKNVCRAINDMEIPEKLSLAFSRERGMQKTQNEDNGAYGFQ